MADYADPAAAVVGASDDSWGALNNARHDAHAGGLTGSSTISPDLKEGAFSVGGTTIETTADEFNKLHDLSGGVLSTGTARTVETGIKYETLDQGDTTASQVITLDPDARGAQKWNRAAAFTLQPPTSDCSMRVFIAGTGAAPTITLTGWTKVKGAFSNATGVDHMVFVEVLNGSSLIVIEEMS